MPKILHGLMVVVFTIWNLLAYSIVAGLIWNWHVAPFFETEPIPLKLAFLLGLGVSVFLHPINGNTIAEVYDELASNFLYAMVVLAIGYLAWVIQ